MALDLLLIAAVLIGISVQAAIGFGFAFFVAPAAFAIFAPEQAVTLVLALGIAIGCLVLFGERRPTEVARRRVVILLAASLPGMIAGAWIVTHADRDLLQLLVGVIVLASAAAQSLVPSRGAAADPSGRDAIGLELGGGLAAGALTTSVTVNGPAVVVVFTRLGLRGTALRDSLAAALLGLGLLATPVLLVVSGGERALPPAWALLACLPAVLIGHRFGAAVFRRLDDDAHHRVALGAAAVAGLLSIASALVG